MAKKSAHLTLVQDKMDLVTTDLLNLLQTHGLSEFNLHRLELARDEAIKSVATLFAMEKS
jgi:hypothetical protein